MINQPTFKLHLDKLQRYCAYQERCHFEVETKMRTLGIYGEEKDTIIQLLIEENFLNELRFAQNYTSGHIRLKRWGRNKIQQGLENKRVSHYCIDKALDSINAEQYLENLEYLSEKKSNLLERIENAFEKRQKLQNYLTQKGYTFKEMLPFLTQFTPL